MTSRYIKNLILVTLFLMSLFEVKGQVEPQFSNYMYNVQHYNPAFAGVVESGSITGIYRSQWTGISGAPESQFLSYVAPLSDQKMGIGLNLINDKIGPASYKSFSALYSYNLDFGSGLILSLGVNAGGSLLDIDFTKGAFENPGDVSQNNISNEFYARVGAGFILHSDSWFVGASVPNFFKQDFYDEEVRNVVADKIQYNVLAGYQFYLNRNLTFRPSV